MLPHAQGIYVITNVVNLKVYVGSSLNIARRAVEHRCLLNAKTHTNAHLQRAWNKYGADAFQFRVLELVPDDAQLLAREQAHIDALDAANGDRGYNAVPFANAGRAKKSEAHRAAIAAATARRWATMPAEKRESLLAKQRARVVSPEQRRHLSQKQRSNPTQVAHMRALADRQRGGRLTVEHRRRVSEALKGRPHSAAHVAAIARTKASRKVLVAA
ncbi:MAG: GIY-YIG nuclease family protein [Vicinamibacterales bacterium]